MWIKEVDLAGVCFSPFVIDLLAAAAAFFLCRWVLARLGALSKLWHLGLFEISLFILILSAVVYQ